VKGGVGRGSDRDWAFLKTLRRGQVVTGTVTSIAGFVVTFVDRVGEYPAGPVAQLPEGVDRDIVNHRILFAIKAIREVRGCTLHEALDVLAGRYEELRRERPDDFTVSIEGYGRGFYS
jgi:hypothetical protein